MTNKFNNWDRLERVIEWANTTTNAFALEIGLLRSEALYHIKRGNFGISFDLANRIVKRYPQIDRTWLLTGVGSMLCAEKDSGEFVPYYSEDAESMLHVVDNLTPRGNAYVPYINNCDLVMRCESRSMSDKNTAMTLLFLRRSAPDDIVQGNEYVIVTSNRTTWCKVRMSHEDNGWRLVLNDSDGIDDIIVSHSDILQAWRVVAKMEVLVS